MNRFFLDDTNENISQQWLGFFETGIKKYEKDMLRYHALKEKLPEDSKKIINSINDELKNSFTEDLILDHRLSKESFEVSIVDYNKEIDKRDAEHHEEYTEYAKAVRTS